MKSPELTSKKEKMRVRLENLITRVSDKSELWKEPELRSYYSCIKGTIETLKISLGPSMMGFPEICQQTILPTIPSSSVLLHCTDSYILAGGVMTKDTSLRHLLERVNKRSAK